METIKVEYASTLKRVLLRFLRTFFAGGLSAIASQFIAIPQISTLTDLKTYALSIIVGFIAGGLAALDKWIRE